MNKLLCLFIAIIGLVRCIYAQQSVKERSLEQELEIHSKKVQLPYGTAALKKVHFPVQWYCGGGYLETSLRKAGLSDKDSIRFSKPYFDMIAFNKDADQDTTLSTLTIPQVLDSIPGKGRAYGFIQLPRINGFSIFGILVRQDDRFFNPYYITVKGDKICDTLTAYESSATAVQSNKIIFVDKDGSFYTRTFTNIDGYEVHNGPLERYTINNSGKFQRRR
ncbi:hypothetical protein [Niabella beijingensis]|uniref:hypothetical protein n=1 Tax=Niabella beijingensis TaxID=2872700 RepID=UPI001CBEDBE9|nr:hypothetical protein [Niabella beijingensis]MBZ4190993.1 hypothetical protein [Niabella beijingensis]